MKKYATKTGLEVLERGKCRMAFDFIEKAGTAYYSEIAKTLGIDNGTIMYALHLLEKDRLIVSEHRGNKLYYRISGDARALMAREERGFEETEESGGKGKNYFPSHQELVLSESAEF